MLLDKSSEKVLDYIINNSSEMLEFQFEDKDYLKLGLPKDVVNAIIEDLIYNRFLTSSVCDIFADYFVKLTYRGYAYFKYKKIAQKQYWKDLFVSKISDILVAFITTLIAFINMPHIFAIIRKILLFLSAQIFRQ